MHRFTSFKAASTVASAALLAAASIASADAANMSFATRIPVHQQMITWGVKKNIEVAQRADGSLPLRLITVK